MSAGASAGQRARIAALVEPVVAQAGYDLEDLSISQAGRRSLVRVVVDVDGGVSLDNIAEVSRAVSAALDEADAENGLTGRSPYTLEVTSPGVDRPLTLPRHWARNVGRLVSVILDGKPVTGRVTAAAADAVTLDIGGSPREIAYSAAGPGKVQVEFTKPGKPGTDAAETGDGTDEEGDDA
ncbi:MAG: ribosome maturation factor RimP [Cryptosporangiaceae bacterium]|nr:ribosome maturation factor RimP [Cryptosporangiaceae bacterium]